MKNHSLKYFCGLIIVLCIGGCSSDNAAVKGRFAGHSGETLYVERVLPGRKTVVDSVVLDDKGQFSFRVTVYDGQATMYNVRTATETIPLIVAPGERITLTSIGNLTDNYAVSGSEGSERLRELLAILSSGQNKMDSLLNAYAATDPQQRVMVEADFTTEYFKTKREHIRFIIENATNLAGLYALYQRLPNDRYISNAEDDLRYFRMMADSLSGNFSASPYYKALLRDIATAEAGIDMSELVQQRLNAEPEGFPEIVLPDIYGTQRKLSDLTGKVIVLDFWSAEDAAARMNNAEYKRLYDMYSHRGFEIYQVSVDQSRAMFTEAVQQQRLPWISVSDFQGGTSIAVLTYNVRSVPANYLIDRDGNIVAKDIYGDNLRQEIEKLI